MELFIELKRFLRYLGFIEFDGPYARLYAILSKICIIIIIIGGIGMQAGYFILEKNLTISKQIQCIVGIIGDLYCVVVFFTFTTQTKLFLDIMEVIEKRIDERERKFNRPIYKLRCDQVEYLTVILRMFLIGIIIVMLVVPTSIYSYFNYYVNGMGEESFIQPFPSK